MIEATVKNDRRVSRTISTLRSALVDLILEKHYDEITVQNIIDRANVGRSMFYKHFRDKEDLFIGNWKNFLRMLVTQIDVSRAGTGKFVPLEGFMLHLKDFHVF